jgi:hypothetical protein
MTIFYCLRFEIPQTGGPGPRIYIPQEEGGPVTLLGTGTPFRRLLRLAGWTTYKTPLPTALPLLCVHSLLMKCVYRAVR